MQLALCVLSAMVKVNICLCMQAIDLFLIRWKAGFNSFRKMDNGGKIILRERGDGEETVRDSAPSGRV